MPTKYPDHWHYCRHCAWKVNEAADITAHEQWVVHYFKDHHDIAEFVVKPFQRCKINCIGRPLPDEEKKGMSIWGLKPEYIPDPNMKASELYREMFKED